jgi:hypothetical protein
MRPNRINESIGDRLDRLRLPDIGPATSETGDRHKAVMERRRDNRLPDGPLEKSDDSARSFVDFVPTETGVNHRLANRLELERSEVSGRSMAVELA